MARTNATTGKGTKIGYASEEEGSPNYLLEVTDVPNIPEKSVGSVEATHYESDDSATENVSTGWISVGEASFTCNYLSAQTATLDGLLGVDKWWTILRANGAKHRGYGRLSKIAGTVPNKDVSKSTFTLTFTGNLEYIAAEAGLKTASFTLTLAAGAGSIDLSNLPGTIDMTGLKVQEFNAYAKTGNSGAITIAEGTTNGYALGSSIVLAAGQRAVIQGNDATPDVASGDKILAVSGTGTDKLEVYVVAW